MGRKSRGTKATVQTRDPGQTRRCGLCWRRELPTPVGTTEDLAARLTRYEDGKKVGCPYYHGGKGRRPLLGHVCGLFARRNEKSYLTSLTRHLLLGTPLPRRKREVVRNDGPPGWTWKPKGAVQVHDLPAEV